MELKKFQNSIACFPFPATENLLLHFKLEMITILLTQDRHFNCTNLTLQLQKSIKNRVTCIELHIKKALAYYIETSD